MTCRALGRRSGSRVSPAFTLAEVLVVLVIIGLVLGVTGTRLDGYRERLRLDNEVKALAGEILKAQLVVMATGSERSLDKLFVAEVLTAAAQPGARNLGYPPEGLAVTVEVAAQIGPDGSCSAGRYRLALGRTRTALVLKPPFCEAIREDVAAATPDSG